MTFSGRGYFILRQFLYEVPYWVFILLVFVLIKFSGPMPARPDVDFFFDNPSLDKLILYTGISGLVLGIILTSLRIFLTARLCRKMSVGKSILMQALMTLLVFISLILALGLYHYLLKADNINSFYTFFNKNFSLSGISILLGFFFYASVQLSLLFEAEKKLGMNVLRNLLLGKYHQPKQENRIFMFLDMQGSTKAAEKLGHLQYSRLLQDVYKLLTDLVIDTKAEIYQFVGDEVVLTWKSKKGYQNNNTLNFFYRFQSLLAANKNYFIKKYGLAPVFKAAIHRGNVSVAEVGEISTQIAYHGDVLNTTSRIQELCNTYKTKLLVSQKFMSGVNQAAIANNFKENAAVINLRGRTQPVTIYALEST